MYQINTAKMFYDYADGQAIVIDQITGMYYGMSSLGSEVLDRIARGCAPDTVLAAVQELADCPADMPERMQQFLSDLVEKEILIPGETAAGGSEAFGPDALIDGFDLTISDFADVQDLILADPIHDVDPEMGWPTLKED